MHSDSQPAEFKRGFNFWMVYVSNLVVDMLSALDLVSVPFAHLRACHSSDQRSFVDRYRHRVADNSWGVTRHRLRMGGERLRHRVHRGPPFHWQPRVRVRQKTSPPRVYRHLCHRVRHLGGSPEHEHAHSRTK